MKEFEGAPLTRREVLIARAAYIAGLVHSDLWNDTGAALRHARDAKERYPLPKVTRPRTVPDPLVSGTRWLVSGDVIAGEVADAGHWYGISLGHSDYAPVAARVRVWADLLANPTEEVEVGE